MKLIATTALAALLACPTLAQVQQEKTSIHCATDPSVFEEAYGPGKIVFGPIRNQIDYGFLVMETPDSLVALLVLPDNRLCVVWDHEKDGDPA